MGKRSLQRWLPSSKPRCPLSPLTPVNPWLPQDLTSQRQWKHLLSTCRPPNLHPVSFLPSTFPWGDEEWPHLTGPEASQPLPSLWAPSRSPPRRPAAGCFPTMVSRHLLRQFPPFPSLKPTRVTSAPQSKPPAPAPSPARSSLRPESCLPAPFTDQCPQTAVLTGCPHDQPHEFLCSCPSAFCPHSLVGQLLLWVRAVQQTPW